MNKIGICIGASTISIIVLTVDKETKVFQKRHGGNTEKVLRDLIEEIGIHNNVCFAFTGRQENYQPFLCEAEAVQCAIDELFQKGNELPDAVVSIGGQTVIMYELDRRGKIIKAHVSNKCGSGTGEFFFQQIKRLGFDDVEKAAKVALEKESFDNPYVPSSRCSVFCKSDITHACNEKKATEGEIVAGICKMVAEKRIYDLAAKIGTKSIWLIGGGSRIEVLTKFLQEMDMKVEIPPYAVCFEAWGASLTSKENNKSLKDVLNVINKQEFFSKLPPLSNFRKNIDFKEIPRSSARNGDKYILAIDVGSTTTKLVVVKEEDSSIVASYYGYTLGKPHIATLIGLEEIKKNLGAEIEIIGIVVTGSGRYLVEVFLADYEKDTKNQILVKNEIICHATAAEHFNPGVKTILEIGGQDAKYTYLQGGVPVDFVMNEACSAGTGSFLAEVVKETFNIKNPEEIAPVALESSSPLKFGEQCSAFIEADINIALVEKSSKEDIVAGLCYSICFNYINRVVGNRPIIGPISLQGGTAYNEAFCLAMAGVLKLNNILQDGEKIVVSKDAGLMGAIGAALNLKSKMRNGEFKPINTTIERLLKKSLKESGSFECAGFGDCDYRCKIKKFEIDGKKIPFGGFCRRWDLIRKGERAINSSDFDLTIKKDKMLFKEFSNMGDDSSRTVGLLGNLLDLNYLPFFTNLFAGLGFKTILADNAEDADGLRKQGAAFCWPVERSHGMMANLIKKNPDIIFLPHIKGTENNLHSTKTNECCPFIQAQPYFLSRAFPEFDPGRIISPYIDFSAPLEDVVKDLIIPALRLGITLTELEESFYKAWQKQIDFKNSLKMEGRKVLNWLEEDEERMAVVVFGRPYNSLSSHLKANKGITRKISSMGVHLIPYDFLPYENEEEEAGMYWPSGQSILRASRFVAKHPQLFGMYLTNFSCGPDSFIIHKFRHYMANKPFLTLEFDQHTANAGFDTRSEAFLDIVDGYRKVNKKIAKVSKCSIPFEPARVEVNGDERFYIDSDGNKLVLDNPFVKMVYVDMGRYSTQAIAEVTSNLGVKSIALKPADEKCMQLGRKYSSCKECLPYNLMLGSILLYLEKRQSDERTIFFMPDASGPCRFGQYNIFMRLVVNNLKLKNVAFMVLSAKNRYSGFGTKFSKRAWISIVTSGIMDNIHNALEVLAEDPISAQDIFSKCWEKIKNAIREYKSFSGYKKILKQVAEDLRKIPLKKHLREAPKILITGEIYVRWADFTTKQIMEELIKKGFVLIRSPISEWLKYHNLLIKRRINRDYAQEYTDRLVFSLKTRFEKMYEKEITEILSSSGLADSHIDNVDEFVNVAEKYMSPLMKGEAILTIGSSLKEVFERFAGIVVIGPFGCMPTRIAQSILAYTMNSQEKTRISRYDKQVDELSEEFSKCPIFFIEVDGSPMPPITKSQFEVFIMTSKKVGEKMTVMATH
ncbi:MAG: acyl-CoA dehydratase activase [Patescibacteria group bacterium]